MKNLSNQLDILIKKELLQINNKVNGVILLEILKYKILDGLSDIHLKSFFTKIENPFIESEIVDEYRRISTKLSYYSDRVAVNMKEIKFNLLIISLSDFITINIQDSTNKIFSFKCDALKGIVLSQGSTISTSYQKNSVVLELAIKDGISDIENLKQDTI